MNKTSILLISCLFSGAVIAKAGDQTLSFGYLNVNANGTKKLTEQLDTTKPDGVATVYADGYSGQAEHSHVIAMKLAMIGDLLARLHIQKQIIVHHLLRM